MFCKYHVLVKNRRICRVAFYDRSSCAGRQERNGMRSASCSGAVEFAVKHGWEIIASGDRRNQGICFLDVGTGSKSTNRPEFFRALNDPRVDTIAAVLFDRLARGKEAHAALEHAVAEKGKNLIYLTFEWQEKAWAEIQAIIDEFYVAKNTLLGE